MMAAVLLMAGGLSYFAVAADAEPYSYVRQCTKTGCDGIVYQGACILWEHTDYMLHRVNGEACHYEIGYATYILECSNGHTDGTRRVREERGHTCYNT